ncbi:hypothetical protein D3C74_389380 [compost metagenome]
MTYNGAVSAANRSLNVKCDVQWGDRLANGSLSVKCDVELVDRAANGSLNVKCDVQWGGRPANGSMNVKCDVELVDRAANGRMKQFYSFLQLVRKVFRYIFTFIQGNHPCIPPRFTD